MQTMARARVGAKSRTRPSLGDTNKNVAGRRVGEQMECMGNDRSILNMEKLVVENDWRNNNWRNVARRVVLNVDIQKVLIFCHNV